MEALFATPPGDVAEQRRRSELRGYADIPPADFGAEFLLASSRVSRDNCGRCTENQDRGDLVAIFKMIKMYLGSSKICRRPFSVIRFVHNLTPFSILTRTTGRTTNDDL